MCYERSHKLISKGDLDNTNVLEIGGGANHIFVCLMVFSIIISLVIKKI